MLYLFVHTRCTIDMAVAMTGRSRSTVCDWFSLFREVCSVALSHEPLIVGTEEQPVQVDESYFKGRRKYNRGRYLSYDQTQSQDVPDWRSNEPRNNRNFGNRIVGPWVVGITQGKNKVRCFIVEDRKATTLVPLIEKVVEQGSVICSDEWKGYLPLARSGFIHRTVNHKKYFVDPQTGAHTQSIERHWVDFKSWLKRARRPNHLMQSHLDEVSYRKLRYDSELSLLGEFLRDISRYYKKPLY